MDNPRFLSAIINTHQPYKPPINLLGQPFFVRQGKVFQNLRCKGNQPTETDFSFILLIVYYEKSLRTFPEGLKKIKASF